jgi:hypothetical protein
MVKVPLFTTSLESSPLAWGHERALVKLRAHACGGGGLRALKGALVSQAAAERRMQVLASHLDQLRIRDSEICGDYRTAQVCAERRQLLPVPNTVFGAGKRAGLEYNSVILRAFIIISHVLDGL